MQPSTTWATTRTETESGGVLFRNPEGAQVRAELIEGDLSGGVEEFVRALGGHLARRPTFDPTEWRVSVPRDFKGRQGWMKGNRSLQLLKFENGSTHGLMHFPVPQPRSIFVAFRELAAIDKKGRSKNGKG